MGSTERGGILIRFFLQLGHIKAWVSQKPEALRLRPSFSTTN